MVSNGTLGLQSFPTRRHPSISRMIGSPMHKIRMTGGPYRDLPIFIFFNVRVSLVDIEMSVQFNTVSKDTLIEIERLKIRFKYL